MTALPHDPDLNWWCASLPTLTADADKYRWRHLLDAACDDIRAGTPVREALITHDLDVLLDEPVGGTAKGWTGPADLGGLVPPVPVVGNYTCPRPSLDSDFGPGRGCGRIAAADPETGYEPRCSVHDRPMTLRRTGARP